MERDALCGRVVKAVLQGPVRQRVELGEAPADGRDLGDVDVGALRAVVPAAAVDHHVRAEGLEAALERLDLADLVVLLDVRDPELVAVLLQVDVLVLAVRRAEDLRLEVVLGLEVREERHRRVEEVERVDDHDLHLAALEVAQLPEEVRDHAVPDDHRVREDCILVVLRRERQGLEGLGLEVGEAVLLRLFDHRLRRDGVQRRRLQGRPRRHEGAAGPSEDGSGGVEGRHDRLMRQRRMPAEIGFGGMRRVNI